MRPLFFGVTWRQGAWSFEVVFPNVAIDGDHRIVSVPLNSGATTKHEAEVAAIKQMSEMTPETVEELKRRAEFIDCDARQLDGGFE